MSSFTQVLALSQSVAYRTREIFFNYCRSWTWSLKKKSDSGSQNMISNSWFANSLIRSQSSQSSSSTIGIISQIYATPNNVTALKPNSEWFSDMSKSSMFLLLGEMKTLLSVIGISYSVVYMQAERFWYLCVVGKSESARGNRMDTRASCFSWRIAKAQKAFGPHLPYLRVLYTMIPP